MFGEAPDWYLLLRASRYLRVAPWDLADRPVWWQNLALTAEHAESDAQEHQSKRKEGNANRRRAGHSG